MTQSHSSEDDQQPRTRSETVGNRSDGKDVPQVDTSRGDIHATVTGTSEYGTIGTFASHSDSLIGETVTLNMESGVTIGNFRLIDRLGAGGFGAVYKADDLRLGRQVAIKVTHSSASGDAQAYYKRVFHEGRAAAALDHPNIVSIYDVALRDGKPYIVSQLIEGETLRKRIAAKRLSSREAAEMMIIITRAIQYAHRQGVIHRDLKPSNILLDRDGTPYVSDFGIAKHESGEDTISHESSIIGTPAYMSPEQAAGRSKHVDRRSDVYSLGVILYELLSGGRPFRGSSQMLIHHVMHSEPQPPRTFDHSIPHDLETICLKCLQKTPSRRYADCGELADEFQRFLDGSPIQARPVSTPEKFWRLCRRNPTSASLGTAVIVAVIAGLAGVTWQWREAEHSRELESRARRDVETSRGEIAKQFQHSQNLLHNAQTFLIGNAIQNGDFRQARENFTNLARSEGIDVNLLRNDLTKFVSLVSHNEPITDLAISDDEQLLAATGLRTLLVWDVESKQIIHRFREKGMQLRSVAFAPGRHLVAWSGQSGRIHFHDAAQAVQSSLVLNHRSPVNVIRFSADGSKIFSAGDDGLARVWSLDTGEQVASTLEHASPVLSGDFVDDSQIITGHKDGRIRKNDFRTGKSLTLVDQRNAVNSIDVDRGATRFVAGLQNNSFIIGRFDENSTPQIFTNQGGPIVDVEFHDDRGALITTNLFGQMRVWQFPEMKAAKFYRFRSGAGRFAVGRESSQVLAGAGDGTILRIGQGTAPPDLYFSNHGSIRDLAIGGSLFVACHETGPASMFHRHTGRFLRSIPADVPGPSDVSGGTTGRDESIETMTCVDHDDSDERIVLGTDQGQLVTSHTKDGKNRWYGQPGRSPISAVRFDAEQNIAIAGDLSGAVRWWDLSKADHSVEIAACGGVIRSIAIAPHSDRCVCVSGNGIAIVIDTVNRSELRRIDLKSAGHCVGYAPDGSYVAIGDGRGRIQIFQADLSSEIASIDAHIGAVNDLAVCYGGESLVSVGQDEDVVFSHLATKQTGLKIANTHQSAIRSISVSADESWIVTGDSEGIMKTWDTSDK